MTNWVNPDEFEARVAHVARAIWPGSSVSGALMVGGRERDGIYITEECVHLLEATARRDLQKAKDDSEKLKDLGKAFRQSHSDRAVKLWFVTKDAPTAEQRTECLRQGVTPNSFAEFQSRLIDVRTLLACRKNHRFGSNDEVGPTGLGEKKYVDFGVSTSDRSASYKVNRLSELIASGGRYTLLGDFGAGKSTTLIQIYRLLESRFLSGSDYRFPLFLNLRDHHGQNDAVEILERHARKIGFDKSAHLVRAWRAGYCHMLIDGFDEISPLGASAKSSLLKNTRRDALTAVRELVEDQPRGCGLVISGRPNYFDSLDERNGALGTKGFVDLILSDFTDEQVVAYLSACGLNGAVPKWLPKRPYLVATLARRGVELQQGVELDVGAGWDFMLTNLCEREAKIAPGVEGQAVREVLERLSTIARRSFDGMGPLAGTEFVQVFRDVCGFEPDDRGHQLLARLSGLALVRPGEESRTFIDEDFADACRAGDMLRYCVSPWRDNKDRLDGAIRAMGPTGMSVLDSLVPEDQPVTLLLQAFDNTDSAAKLDVFQLLVRRGIPLESGGTVREVAAHSIEVVGGVAHSAELTVADSYVDRVCFEGEGFEAPGIRFASTNIKQMVGPAGPADIPLGFIDADSDVDSWASEFNRNANVLLLSPDLRVAVLITILRKLFLQIGNGRQEDALFRGLNPDAQRYVSSIVAVLEKEGLIASYRKRGRVLWVPDRSAQGRVERIIRAPNVVSDTILTSVRAL